MMRGLLCAFAVAAFAVTAAAGKAETRLLSFAELDGWAADDHAAALDAFLETCPAIRDPDWRAVCELAATRPEPRRFFELMFIPVQVGTPPALFTGYYEPELNGSRYRGGRYQYPVYRRPPELVSGQQWYSRAEIEDYGILEGRGLEIAWVDNPVDVFFLQIQGSGRIRMADGGVIRVGYADRNGHPYSSIGQELVRRGVYSEHQVSMRVIRNWVSRNPSEGRALMQHNPSYVFFRKLDLPAASGPIGAMSRPVTSGRTLAVDPAHTPLGAPVWIEKDGNLPMRRLMVAQDTGGAIKGAQRADIFMGTGELAGDLAGEMRDSGRMVVLMPIERALAQVEEAWP